MSNLEQSYKLILKELRQISDRENFNFQPIKPKLSDIELISLITLAEFKSIDSEYQLFREIKDWEIDGKIGRSVYNRRSRTLFSFFLKSFLKCFKKIDNQRESSSKILWCEHYIEL